MRSHFSRDAMLAHY